MSGFQLHQLGRVWFLALMSGTGLASDGGAEMEEEQLVCLYFGLRRWKTDSWMSSQPWVAEVMSHAGGLSCAW